MRFVFDLWKRYLREECTNQIQTEWMYYICFVLWCVSRSKALLACVWHEEWFYTAGPVPQNGASDLADGKPWVSMLLSWNGFTILSPVTFLVFRLSTNVPLMLLISWLLTLYARSLLSIMADHTFMTLQWLSARPSRSTV